ncbi:hypothetical protein EB796_015706 [Bugula neritina]|uniref:Uncharacterized protein n=1 Tax=Bugula neritina TaxID=10212 RepID=A0A7J7JIT7_BUGNE|nr:hypothetical protein EB796_015706 [Bugula neritina]
MAHVMNSSALNSNDLLLTGCPTNQEVFSFLIQDGLKTASVEMQSVRLSLHLLILWPSDMIYYSETQPYIADRVSVESRLNAGLLGLTVTRESNSEDFTVHMLTGKGDLFQQTYVQTGSELSSNSLKEVTHSAGPRLSNEEIPDHVTQRCSFWYSEIADVEVEDDAGNSEHPPRLHVRNIDVTQSLQQCAVCRGGLVQKMLIQQKTFSAWCVVCLRVELLCLALDLNYTTTWVRRGSESPPFLLLLILSRKQEVMPTAAYFCSYGREMISQLLWLKETENGTIDERGYYAELLVKAPLLVKTLTASLPYPRSSARKRTEAHSVISRVSRRSAGNSSVTFKPNVDFFSSTLPSKMLDTPNTSLKPASQSQSLKRSKTKSRGRKGF